MTFADKDSADENCDTDTDSSDGSNKDLLSKVSQENIFLPLHGSTPVGNVLGNLHGTGESTDSDVAGSSAVTLNPVEDLVLDHGGVCEDGGQS